MSRANVKLIRLNLRVDDAYRKMMAAVDPAERQHRTKIWRQRTKLRDRAVANHNARF